MALADLWGRLSDIDLVTDASGGSYRGEGLWSWVERSRGWWQWCSKSQKQSGELNICSSNTSGGYRVLLTMSWSYSPTGA